MKESLKLEEFRLECTFDQAMTREIVLNKFDGYFVLECEPITVNVFILSFKYRDTMLKALAQIKDCEMQLASKSVETVLQKAKRKVGVLGKRYPYQGHVSLS